MPPAVSEDGSDRDSPDNIPAREIPDEPMANATDAEDDEDGEEDEEVYQVESIVGHRFKKGVLEYHVKWLGYEEEKDLTYEPVENMDGSEELVKAYHLSIGGTPERGSTKKVKGKRSASQAFDSPVPSESKKKPGRKSQTNGASADWVAPIGSWEDHVVKVAAIVECEEPSTKKGGSIKSLEGLLEWTEQHGNRKSQHSMAQLRKKCPQRLLDYYESHLLKPRLEQTTS